MVGLLGSHAIPTRRRNGHLSPTCCRQAIEAQGTGVEASSASGVFELPLAEDVPLPLGQGMALRNRSEYDRDERPALALQIGTTRQPTLDHRGRASHTHTRVPSTAIPLRRSAPATVLETFALQAGFCHRYRSLRTLDPVPWE
jgi:hypothetical protein